MDFGLESVERLYNKNFLWLVNLLTIRTFFWYLVSQNRYYKDIGGTFEPKSIKVVYERFCNRWSGHVWQS